MYHPRQLHPYLHVHIWDIYLEVPNSLKLDEFDNIGLHNSHKQDTLLHIQHTFLIDLAQQREMLFSSTHREPEKIDLFRKLDSELRPFLTFF
jgi:hypothetical protein